MGGSAGRNGRLCGGRPPAPSEQRILTHSIRHNMATLYKEGVEGKYKWLTPKQAKKYGIPPEYKLMEETVLSHLAKIRIKQDAKG